MSVIIKNYDMPDSCYECDLHNYHICNITGESIEEQYNEGTIRIDCPLRPTKKGKWIIQKLYKENWFSTEILYREVCSNCFKENASCYRNFCPNCGSSMSEGE